ncbi:MAG: hypothetical protein HY558_08515 [Euryarchaeota archaeon]|nr:hypothetical protein [Euryarchaeota archaeon]
MASEPGPPLGRVPTGISSLDLAVRGGLPIGSLAVLLGEAGAGHTEFAYTSAVRLARLRADPDALRSFRQQVETLTPGEEIASPERVVYISLSRNRPDVVAEMSRLFSPEEIGALQQGPLFIKDLSELYYAGSAAPSSWVTAEPPRGFSSLKNEGRAAALTEELIKFLNTTGPGSLIILDSLSDLVRYNEGRMSWRDLIITLQGLQRAAKVWGGLVYVLLSKGILEPAREEEVAATADGVLVFQWEETPSRARQRTLHIRKFRGLLPLLTREGVAKFETSVTPRSGFEMNAVKMVVGRK